MKQEKEYNAAAILNYKTKHPITGISLTFAILIIGVFSFILLYFSNLNLGVQFSPGSNTINYLPIIAVILGFSLLVFVYIFIVIKSRK